MLFQKTKITHTPPDAEALFQITKITHTPPDAEAVAFAAGASWLWFGAGDDLDPTGDLR